MSDVKSNKLKKLIDIAYKIYHFVAKVVLYSILIVLILVAIGFAIYFVDLMKNIKSGDNKPPLLSAYVIISPSMEPTIKVEDAIVIVRHEPEDLEVGDIITFLSNDPRYSGITITHRIVGIEKSNNGKIFFRTKGDNNNSEDAALVPSENVYGRVVLKIPKIGYIQYALTRSYGWLVFVVIPCLGIVIYDIIKLFKAISKAIPSKNSKKEKKEVVDLIGDEPKESRIIDTKQEIEKETKVEEVEEIKEETEEAQDEENNEDVEVI